MIEAWFETLGLDRYVIDFPAEPMRCAASLHAMKEGAVLFAVSLLSRWFSADATQDLLRICNLWNVSHKWPTAVVELDDDANDRVDIRVENSLFVPSGCTQGQVDDFLSEHLRASLDFFAYLALEFQDG
jgi:hypothetical protein